MHLCTTIKLCMNKYRIKCILPRGRYGLFDDSRSIVDFYENEEDEYEVEATFPYLNERGVVVNLSTPQLEEVFQFEYSRYLTYLHEHDLRNYSMWSVEGILQTSDALHVASLLNQAYIHPNTIIKHAGEAMGHGLFVQEGKVIAKDSLIGEYTGVVGVTSEPCAYSMNYPSADGGYEIRALEVGNVIRFVNHSILPNACFVPVQHEGIAHIICMTLRDIYGGEQILANYGEAYWIGQKAKPSEIID